MMSIETFRKTLNQRLEARWQSEMVRWKEQSSVAPPSVLEAVIYATAGGKRIRPLLLLLSYQAICGEEPSEPVWEAAMALESVHAYSLVHDDLPCMDDDALRRGRPTVHIAFGEAEAVLAGDALLTGALEGLLRQAVQLTAPWPERLVKAAQVLVEAAGLQGMIGGQAMDLDSQVKSRSALQEMVEKKTGALLIAACQMGAHLAGASEKDISALTAYARHLGLAFQAKDDIFDRGKDEEKQTLLAECSLEEAQAYVSMESEAAVSALSDLSNSSELVALARALCHRNY